jgi:hypothetical protein
MMPVIKNNKVYASEDGTANNTQVKRIGEGETSTEPLPVTRKKGEPGMVVILMEQIVLRITSIYLLEYR